MHRLQFCVKDLDQWFSTLSVGDPRNRLIYTMATPNINILLQKYRFRWLKIKSLRLKSGLRPTCWETLIKTNKARCLFSSHFYHTWSEPHFLRQLGQWQKLVHSFYKIIPIIIKINKMVYSAFGHFVKWAVQRIKISVSIS